MRILLDECVPKPLKKHLSDYDITDYDITGYDITGYDIKTVVEMGLGRDKKWFSTQTDEKASIYC